MSKENKNIIQPEEIDEEMTVTLDLEDGSVTCSIVTILVWRLSLNFLMKITAGLAFCS